MSKRPRYDEGKTKQKCSKSDVENKDVLLLVGDSIIDNRKYAQIPTGLILMELLPDLKIFDNAVEETATVHFKREQREVPDEYYKDAQTRNAQTRNYYPYLSDKIANFPEANVKHVVVSVGGNDAILQERDLHTIGSSVVEVLNRYKETYPSARIWYVKPYKLTPDLAWPLRTRLKHVNGMNKDELCNFLNFATDQVCQAVSDSGFELVDSEWQTIDVSLSEDNIPEPTSDGARRLAKAIAKNVQA